MTVESPNNSGVRDSLLYFGDEGPFAFCEIA
ncbi:hypothetical protein SAMN05216337_1010103 [Bradyrhizobium brasilense]|uniref:Uncharacterized protein n=1 Tax=Bradyrhizobium brasilense TaxID=1419277 RepID=A0A1G6U2W1_9BRAD|nr:hypothetical protein SAMN05216337_1010103 [Bradyrhizobium brasilense]